MDLSGKSSKAKTKKQKPPKEKPVIELKRIDHTAIWTKQAKRRRRFNRMDPDPDPPLYFPEEAHEFHEPHKDKQGKIKLELTSDDWKKFWVDRVRKHYQIDAPNITDKEIYDAMDRDRRIFLRNREEGLHPRKDPDLPSCYYWDKFQVSEWAKSAGVPEKLINLLLENNFSGRHLILLDANMLSKMGEYNLSIIKSVTRSVRSLLGLPNPNGMRAICRQVPLEKFLLCKIRTGPKTNKLTFKEFCENEGIDYEPATVQKNEGYQKLPKCMKVTINPEEGEDILWVHPAKSTTTVKRRPRATLPYFPFAPKSEYDMHFSDQSDSSSSDGISLVEYVPTVEELLRNAMVRNEFMPTILNDMVEAVFEHVKARKAEGKCRQKVVDEIIKQRMELAYSYFRIGDPEEKLKFATIIAEELVEDVLKAREILEDIDSFQERIQRKLPEQELLEMQEAVAYYVQGIMPQVVSAALKEMNESEQNLKSRLDSEEDLMVKEFCVIKGASSAYEEDADSENSSEGVMPKIIREPVGHK